MRFAFSAEQLAARDLARELFERESPPPRLRAVWSEDGPRDRKLWRTMGEVGLLGPAIPEELGGAGGDEVDLALVLEEAGRAALPEPLAEAAVAALLLRESGTDAQREDWLPRLAAGEALVTLQLEGQSYALDADDADLLVMQRGRELHAVPRAMLRARRIRSEDGARRLFAVEAETSADTEMPGGAGLAPLRAAAATAAVLNGVSGRLLEMTLDHVRGRHQFGRAVGSFQAVQHQLASVHVALDAARSSAWYAAWALAQGRPDAPSAARVAKAAAAEAGALANTAALQCHGGIGFTWEHDLHRWLKRGKALEAAHGGAMEHRRALAAALFEGTEEDGDA